MRNVQNELVIGPNASGSTRANDAYLTSKVKARFVSENKFKANHVKVITENGTVYLMGLVKQAGRRRRRGNRQHDRRRAESREGLRISVNALELAR